ncbi:hypothetical protein ACFE04_000439 [Oxalis oulophora]
MSADLDLRQNLSNNRLSPPSTLTTAAIIKINATLRPPNCTGSSGNDCAEDLKLRDNLIAMNLSPPPSTSATKVNEKVNDDGGDNNCEKKGEEDCLTPTSAENKIPEIQCCPPAPRKSKGSSIPCKRKLEFFEIRNHEQVDEFFRSNYELIYKRRSIVGDL